MATNPKISQVVLPGSDQIYDLKGKTAEKLDSPFTIELTGDVTGSAVVDGSGDVSIETTANFQDTKVTQSGIGTDSWRGVIVGDKSSDEPNGSIEDSVTDTVHTSNSIKAQPSSGTLRANYYRFGDDAHLEYDSTVQSIKFVFLS